MDKQDSAVILDLRTLVGTANVFAKQDMYRVMYPGSSVDIKHFSNTENIELSGPFKLFVLTVKTPAAVTIDNKEIYINRILVYDDICERIIIAGENLVGTYLALTPYFSQEEAIVDEAIVDESILEE